MWSLTIWDITNDELRFLNQDDTRFSNTHTWLMSENVSTIIENPHTLFNKWNSRKDNSFTIVDFSKIRFKSESVLIDFIRDNLWLKLDNNNGVIKFNNYYKKVIKIYESRYLRKLPNSIKTKKFNNPKQILDFLKHTWIGRNWIYICEISKLLFVYIDSLRNEVFRHLKEIHIYFINKNKLFIQINEDYSEINRSQWCFTHEWRIMNIKMLSRQKSIESIVWKLLSDPKYWSIWQINDLVAIELDINVNNKSDIIFLLQQYYMSWNFDMDNINIKNKRILCLNDLNEVRDQLDNQFCNWLEWELNVIERWWKWTPLEYQDVKIKWKMNLERKSWLLKRNLNVWVEIKIVLNWNNNEYWLKFHPIYDYKKRFRELTRLWSYVRLKDIVNYVNDFFEKLDTYLEYKWKNRSDYLLELFTDLSNRKLIDENIQFNIKDKDLIRILSKALFYNFISELNPVKRSKKSKKIYFVHPNYLDRSRLGIVPPVYEVDTNDILI